MSFLNRITDKVYIINLEKDKEKLKSVTNELEKQQIVFERFDAVDGATITNDTRLTEFCNSYCGYGIKGCALSHMTIWDSALKKGYQTIAIFEDDVIFNSEFNILLQLNYYNIPNDFDIIYLGSMFDCGDTSTYNTIREKISNIHNERINKNILKVSACGGMYGYIISKKCIEKLLNKKINFHIDGELIKFNLKAYAFQPVLVEQNINNSNLNSKYPLLLNSLLSHIKLTNQNNPIPLSWLVNETAFQYKHIKLCTLTLLIFLACFLVPLKYYYILYLWLVLELLASFDFNNTLVYGIIVSIPFFIKSY